MLKPSDTPIKRVGFLAMMAGLALIAIAFTAVLDTRSGYFIDRILEGPFRAYRSWGHDSLGWAAFQMWTSRLRLRADVRSSRAMDQDRHLIANLDKHPLTQ